MLESAYPGGREEKHQLHHSRNASMEDDSPPSKQAKFNSLVSSFRSFESVGNEVILSARNFLEKRLKEEQNEQITAMIALVTAKNAKEKITASCQLVNFLKALIQ